MGHCLQATMDYMINDGPGRAAFVRYWELLAQAVAQHPSAIACELMNEPMTIQRYDAWDALVLFSICTSFSDLCIPSL